MDFACRRPSAGCVPARPVAAAATSATGGVFGLRSTDNTSLNTFANYTDGQTYHIEFDENYTTGTAGVYVNGVQVMANYQFWISGAPGVTTNETFMSINGNGDISTQVALSNITGDTTLQNPVPEPATMCPLVLGGLAILRKRRNK